jgi:hypothetical protein
MTDDLSPQTWGAESIITMPSFAELERQIYAQAHAVVPLPMTHAEFRRAIGIFIDFLKLPMPVKEALYFKVRPDDRGSEVGYKRYRRDEGQTDNREYFHYHRLAEKRFGEPRAQVRELDELLRSMKAIYGSALRKLEEIIRTFDGRFPGIHEKFFATDRPGNFYLRFVKYDRARPGEFLAKGHYDRGSCTLALAESAPGLRMGTNDTDLREVVHREGEALFMPGLKFSQVTSEEFAPTWHDVLQKGDDAFNEEIARWAIVLFADPADMPIVTFDEAHTPRR